MQRARNSAMRAAFTLLELLLAVALLSVLIAISVPSVNALISERNARSLVADIESFLDESRRLSIDTQQPQWVRYSVQDRYLISGAHEQPASRMLEIPEPFHFGKFEYPVRLESEMMGELSLNPMELSWSTELLYFPDATTTGDVLMLELDQRSLYTIEVRSLTGSLEVKRVTSGSETLEVE